MTVESVYNKDYDSIILCDDMVLRDLNAVFGKYKFTKIIEKALNGILALINLYNPLYVNVFFDNPVSFSGELGILQ